MSNLLAARAQMAMSLGFHILFAVAGIAMPLLMVTAEALWLRTRQRAYLELARRWAKGTAVLFAVGAISGTVLSFELGLLWPRFMAYAGPIIGMPFSLEGLAFFLEAIFLGIYLYGWDRVSPRAHCAAGALVLLSGTASGLFVVAANAWMNTPVGFSIINGRPAGIHPFQAMLSPAALPEALHMTLASFLSVGMMVAAIHAWQLLKKSNSLFHRFAYGIALSVGGAAALLQPLSGDFSARHLARYEKTKLAAMEGLWETQKRAPLRIGGWVDADAETTRYALDIPMGLSLLAYHDAQAQVQGLTAVPKSDRPPVGIVHAAFDLMVFCGLALAAVTLIGCWLAFRNRGLPTQRWYLKSVAVVGPLGFIALEAGWTVTEVGRQPWIISGLMRVKDGVTPMPWLAIPFTIITILYLFLALTVLAAFNTIVHET
ncbi:MAG: cytochrome ubiquinol oxidase subunit I [Elusimicrobiota bacterium]